MGVGKTVDNRIGIMIARATVPTFEPGIRTELHHAERQSSARVSMTVSAGANEGIYIINGFFVRLARSEIQRKQEGDKKRKILHDSTSYAYFKKGNLSNNRIGCMILEI